MQVHDLEIAGTTGALTTARDAGLKGCPTCGLVHRREAVDCRRCGTAMAPEGRRSLDAVWAWLIAGIIVYIPANLYPMLRTSTLLDSSEATIVGGAIELVSYGNYGVALIVFFASIVIPIGKFLAIAYLALSLRPAARARVHQRHRLFEVVEFIGRWSMIDVFVVAILSALVQLGSVATINPGIAAVSFLLSVAFTMLAALSFDPKLIWDADKEPQ